MRLIVADDAVLFRDALAGALQSRGHDVVGQAGDAVSLVDLVAEVRPDLAIIDIRMPPGDGATGIDAALRIRALDPSIALLLLSQHVETADLARLLGSDASGVGYLLKDRVSNVDELADAVARLAAGATVIDPTLVAALMGRSVQHNVLDELTRRERDVLALMAEGRSNRGIADRLDLTPKTVETHVTAIFSKLGLEPTDGDHRRVLAVIAWLRDR